MSIKDAIEAHCKSTAKTLRLHVPARPSYVVQRHIFLGQDVQRFIDLDGSIDSRFRTVAGRANSRLDSISNGCYVTFGMEPHDKKASCLIARVDPVGEGIVDVRLTDPKPAVRMFGAFAATDILVLLQWAPRENLNFRKSVEQCRKAWDLLFPGLSPVVSNKVEDYVSKHFHIG